jgi:hypothetical protein
MKVGQIFKGRGCMFSGIRFVLSAGFAVVVLMVQLEKAGGQQATRPLSLHPENHRYFLFRGKPTVLVTSGEHYGLLLNRAFDFRPYFKELASHGLNHTRVFSGVYREVASSFGITQNQLAPDHDDYLCPWKRSGKTHPDGSPIFDLKAWDESYFKRLEAMMQVASEQDIVVEMCLFCPMYKPVLWEVNPMNSRNNVNGVGDCGPTEVYTLKEKDLFAVQSALAQKMVEALLPFDNVYLEICNEPYFGGVTEDWQRAMIDVIVAKQKQVGSRHLLSVNVANKSKKIEDPHPAISIFNFHYCHPPVVVAENQHVRGVIGENETGFRGPHDFLYRTEGWDFLVAGGATYNNLDYSFSVEHPTGTLTNYASPGGGNRTLRRQLSILKSTFDQLPIPDIHPQPPSFVEAPSGMVASAIGQPGKVYLVYLHVDIPGRINDQPMERFLKTNSEVQVQVALPTGRYRLEQLDTQSGAISELPVLEIADSTPARIPLQPFVTDTALRIEWLP